jgi:hypothetical protein
MFLTTYQLYVYYHYLVTFHGIYVTLSFLSWAMGTTYEYTTWLISFVYDPYPPLLLEDKKTCKSK